MKTYAIAGTGNRGLLMYGKMIHTVFCDEARIVGLFDPNKKRCAYAQAQLSMDIPIFDDFEAMLDAVRPDVVIITTVDCFHAEYIKRAFAMGCDVICEKPLAITAGMCRAIQAAEREYGRKVTVTFNCRFMPFFVKLKEFMRQNAVGRVLHVDFEWMLDTDHGADYFRRWHRRLDNSGGLLVHKATHHFDVINWLIEQEPVDVSANGTLQMYGKNGAFRSERCTGCAHRGRCAFAYPEPTETVRKMYFEAEAEDGYFRDRCVFAEEIDIYDSMSLSVGYSQNAILTYSLIAHSPHEGWRMSISGTEGRLEAEAHYSGLDADDPLDHVRVFNRAGERMSVDVKKQEGGHGGSDERMLRMILCGGADPLNQGAGSHEGVMSAIIGIAANISIAENRRVSVAELLCE